MSENDAFDSFTRCNPRVLGDVPRRSLLAPTDHLIVTERLVCVRFLFVSCSCVSSTTRGAVEVVPRRRVRSQVSVLPSLPWVGNSLSKMSLRQTKLAAKASALVGVEPTEQTRCSVFGCRKLMMMLKGAA